jgi:tRNA (cmo5U34)-methyltransferase
LDAETQTDEQSSLAHMPNGRWDFDESVTAVFTDMLAKSIPQYPLMRQTVLELGLRYTRDRTAVVDLGCSRGDSLAPFVERRYRQNRFIGVDTSRSMLEASRRRFATAIAEGVVDIRQLDLRAAYPDDPASLTLSILTLQFTPIEYRHRILRDVYDNLIAGGAFIFVEKILGSSAEIGAVMIDMYHLSKQAAGYSIEAIECKRKSLEGVLVPLPAAWNEQLLAAAGFRHIDCFWRWMNFCGWIAVK